MAVKKAVVLTNGQFELLQAGDTLEGVGGSATLTETEIDFGTKPVNNKTFTITDSGVSVSNKIIVTGSASDATGQVGNDWEVDSAMFSAKANSGNFTLYANAQFSISGKRKIYYQILS
jgi:hypothetical protein